MYVYNYTKATFAALGIYGDNLLYLLRTCWLPGNHWEERLELKLAARALLLCRGSNPFMWCVHCTESKINVYLEIINEHVQYIGFHCICVCIRY